jgi:hypothetical protein
LRTYGVLGEVAPDRIFEHVEDVFAAYEALPPSSAPAPGAPG